MSLVQCELFLEQGRYHTEPNLVLGYLSKISEAGLDRPTIVLRTACPKSRDGMI